MTSRERVTTLMYPSAFAVSYVLLTFNALPTPTWDLARPVLVVVGAAVLVTLVAGTISRSLHRGAVIGSIVSAGLTAPFVVAAVFAAIGLVLSIQLLRRRWTLGGIRSASAIQVSHLLRVLAGSFLVVAAVTAVPAIVGGVAIDGGKVADVVVPSGPNVYVLLLDGYPRGDTLEAVYGFDNAPFERSLEDLGFGVAGASRSNYNHTWMTLSSLMNGAFVEDLIAAESVPSAEADQFRVLTQAINDATMLDLFREHGYQIEAVPPPFMSLGLQTADRYRDSAQLTAFEYSLLENSFISELAGPVVASFALSQQRGRFEAALRAIEDAAQGDGRRVVFSHIFSPPHAPLLYGPLGEHMPPAECLPSACALWEFPDDEAWAALPGQIEYLNRRLLQTIRTVISADRDAVIVLLADHGSRRTVEDIDEHFHSFFAARTPRREVFPDDPHPVNLFRLLAAEYLDEPTGPLPYRAWVSPTVNRPLDTVAVPDTP